MTIVQFQINNNQNNKQYNSTLNNLNLTRINISQYSRYTAVLPYFLFKIKNRAQIFQFSFQITKFLNLTKKFGLKETETELVNSVTTTQESKELA